MADQVTEAPSPEKNPATVYLELTQAQADDLVGTMPEDEVTLNIVGTVRSFEVRKPYSESADDYVGSISVEVKSLKAQGRSAFDDLADDD